MANIHSLLTESFQELGNPLVATKTLSIVEFLLACNLSEDKVISLSEELIETMPAVTISEWDLGSFFKKPAAPVDPNRTEMLQKMTSVGAGRPVLKIYTPGPGNNIRYIVFPDLDLSRPGHKAVLDSVKAGLERQNHQVVSELPASSLDRTGMDNAKVEVYNMISNPANKKAAAERAIGDLQHLIQKAGEKIAGYRFISAEEVNDAIANVKAKVDSLGSFSFNAPDLGPKPGMSPTSPALRPRLAQTMDAVKQVADDKWADRFGTDIMKKTAKAPAVPKIQTRF